MTYKEAIELKCRDCNFDEPSAGTFLQQTAACECASCPLHALRPMPKGYRVNGVIDAAKLATLRERIEAANRARANR